MAPSLPKKGFSFEGTVEYDMPSAVIKQNFLETRINLVFISPSIQADSLFQTVKNFLIFIHALCIF